MHLTPSPNTCGCCYLSPSEVCDIEYREEFLADLDAAPSERFRPSPARESAASAVRAPAVVRSGWATLPMFDLLVIAAVAFSLGYCWRGLWGAV